MRRTTWRTAAAGAAAALLLTATGCASDESPDPDPGGDPTVSETRLDRDGIDRILESGEARLDLRDLELTRDEVGLPPDRLGPIVGRPGGPAVELTLQGPDGEETVTTSTFSATFTSSSDTADSVTWFESYDTEAEAFEALEAAVDTWGLRPEAIDNWRETLARGGEQDVSLPLGVSPSGFVTQVTVRGEQGAGQTHQWTVLLDPRYYEPDALDLIRRTGETPPRG